MMARPQNKEELFNLRHASAHNAIERIFGVLKRRFQILLLAPEYSLKVQSRIPAALAAIHNFISIHNPCDQPISSTISDSHGAGRMYDDTDDDDTMLMGANDADLRRNMIAQQMWDDYVCICAERGIDRDAALDDDEFEDDNDDEFKDDDEDGD